MELILDILRSISYALVEPTYLIMFVIIGIMFYLKNKKIAVMQKITIGESVNSPLELTLSQLVLGVLAGTIASILLGLLGVVFTENSGIEWIFLISILLIFIKPKFVCFSYSAAILGGFTIIANLVGKQMGKPVLLEINILQIMTLVGVLHVIEGFLVFFDGKRGAIPVFSHKDNKIVGGFAFNRMWAIPVAVLTALSVSIGDNPSTPGWWPLINSQETLVILATTFLTALPFYGMIGYNTVTFTQSKTKKVSISALLIFIYGLSLTLVAQVASFGIGGEILVVIYAPLAHEGMLRLQKYIENKGKYLYYSDEYGITILEVAPNSPAYAAGIRRGDKVIAVNNEEVVSEVQILSAIKESYLNLAIQIRKASGEIVDYVVKPKNKRVGMLLVPRMVNKDEIIGVNPDSFRKIFEELKNKK